MLSRSLQLQSYHSPLYVLLLHQHSFLHQLDMALTMFAPLSETINCTFSVGILHWAREFSSTAERTEAFTCSVQWSVETLTRWFRSAIIASTTSRDLSFGPEPNRMSKNGPFLCIFLYMWFSVEGIEGHEACLWLGYCPVRSLYGWLKHVCMVYGNYSYIGGL